MSPVADILKFTYSDYCLFPEDGRRHEIVDGEHYVTPAPYLRHQAIVGNLQFRLRSHLETNPVGILFAAPCDVVLSEFNVVQPDLVFVATTNAGVLTEANIQGVPDLVIEVLSPSTRKVDLTVKKKLYERAGVLEYWVVDPEEETVQVFRLGEGGYGGGEVLSAERGDGLTSAILPGLRLALASVFQG